MELKNEMLKCQLRPLLHMKNDMLAEDPLLSYIATIDTEIDRAKNLQASDKLDSYRNNKDKKSFH